MCLKLTDFAMSDPPSANSVLVSDAEREADELVWIDAEIGKEKRGESSDFGVGCWS